MVAQHSRLASLTRRFFARYGFELKSALPVSKSTGIHGGNEALHGCGDFGLVVR